jgi:hypothetical protein
MEEERKKHIDESWKEAVSKEKEGLGKDKTATPPPPEPSFSFFISTLALQASVFLGDIPNPATNKKEKNLTQAKFIIDTLGVLREKTRNNLTDDENKLLEDVLYQLRMQYVGANKEVK